MTEVRTEFVHTGESASLYNCTLSPGFTEAEVKILRLALIKFGVGKWTDIVHSGCLPGKTPAQLNLQSQRLLGQQSTAEFMGLHIDPDPVRIENAKKQGPDVRRKNNCIVNSGNKMRREEIKEKLKQNMELYGVAEEVWKNIELPTVEMTKAFGGNGMTSTPADAGAGICDDIETDSEAPYTSESDTDNEVSEETERDGPAAEGDNVTADVLRLKLQEDLARLTKLAERRKELRALIKTEEERLKKKSGSDQGAVKLNGTTAKSGKPSKKAASGKRSSKSSTKKTSERKRKVDSDETEEGRTGQQPEYNEDEEDSACTCFRGYVEGEFMLDCDSCHKWFHGECVGVPEDIPDDFSWLCAECCP